MFETKRRRMLSQYDRADFPTEKVEKILVSLEEIRQSRNYDTHLILQIISDLGKTYNLFVSLPGEILSQIFLHLPSKDLFDERNVFLVCKEWTNKIKGMKYFWERCILQYFGVDTKRSRKKFSLSQLVTYSLLRGRTKNQNSDQEFHFYESLTPNLNFVNKSPHVTVLRLCEKYCSNSINRVEYLMLQSYYVVYLRHLEHLNVTINSVSEITPLGNSKGHNFTLTMDCSVNNKIYAQVRINRLGYSIIVNMETFELLESKDFVRQMVEKNLVSSPTALGQGGKVEYKGELGVINRHQRGNEMFTKTVMYLFCFFEIVLNMKLTPMSDKWCVWKYLDRYVDSRIDFFHPEDVMIETKEAQLLTLKEYLVKRKDRIKGKNVKLFRNEGSSESSPKNKI